MTRKFLAGTLSAILALATLGALADAADRSPPMYNAMGATVTLTANYYAGGSSASVTNVRISWTQTNASSGSDITVTPSTDRRTCTVTNSGGGASQIDVTVTYTNSDGTQASQTVTICFQKTSVDHITVGATG